MQNKFDALAAGMQNNEMDTVSEFGQLLGPLRRAVVRQARAAGNLPDLPESQIEMLRVLIDAGPIAPGDVALRMHIAPSTVSNLARQMSAAGLLERAPSMTDLRTVTLSASENARALFDRYNTTSTNALQQAMNRLSREQQLAIAHALPALKNLLKQLEAT